MSVRDLLVERGLEDAIVFANPDYESAIAGYTPDGRIVYRYSDMVRYLMETDSMSEEDAAEFIDYNTVGAYIENGPIIMYEIEDLP